MGPKSDRFSWGERAKTVPDVIWPIVIFFVIIRLLKGIFTPTEAGSVGVFTVLLLCLFTTNITFEDYVQSVREALRTSRMVLLLVATSNMLGHFIAGTNIPSYPATWVLGIDAPAVLVMAMIFSSISWEVFHRRSCFHHSCHAHILSHYGETGLRSSGDLYPGGLYCVHLVCSCAGRHWCVCGEEHHQNADGCNLCRGLSLPHLTFSCCYFCFHFPADCVVFTEDTDKVNDRTGF